MNRISLSLLLIVGVLFGERSYSETEGVLNRLLAPGPLMGDHKNLEGSDCLKCHEAGKGVPDAKCLDCHKEIRPFVIEKRGFHGLTSQACIECHKDHKGRDFDSTRFDWKTFEHAEKTGYKLEGKHAEIKCQDCHKEKRVKRTLRTHDPKFLGKTTTCLSCHKEDDVHHFTGDYAKKDCNACHGLKDWKVDVKFDHGKDAHYLLDGKHAKISCNECHLVNKQKKIFRYTWPNLKQRDCLICHEDFHKQKLSREFQGPKCLKCHDTTSWKIEVFNHEVTGFKLREKHKEAQCIDCHRQKKFESKKPEAKKMELKNFDFKGLKKDCLSCHDDFHKFAKHRSANFDNLNQCLSCHNESDWKKVHGFDHDKDTKYPLDGKHLELKCVDCHLPGKMSGKKVPPPKVGIYHFEKLDLRTCEVCHANPHVGQFKKEFLQKKCSVCHSTEGWVVMKANKGFDHAKTRFTLDGAHVRTSCSSCHVINKKQVFKFASFEQKFCKDCHEDVHKGQMNEKWSKQACTLCHTTKAFKDVAPTFDHQKTQYPLEGAHAKVDCQKCHVASGDRFQLHPPNISSKASAELRTPVKDKFIFKNRNCVVCHEDIHRKQLGQDCQRCHSVTKWKDLRFEHNRDSVYPLVEKHKDVSCSKCHSPMKNEFFLAGAEKKAVTRYKPLSQLCLDCHKDPHKGSYGQRCQECHTERGWKVTKDFHKNFSLSGVHFTLECAECHYDGRKLAGLGQQCLFCHQKDDVHNGTQPNCKDCHTQHFWEVSRFKHSLTRFPLRGAHRTLDCSECHYRGGSQAMYQGLDSRCESCHLNDALSATSHVHVGSELTNCSSCHRNSFSFGN